MRQKLWIMLIFAVLILTLISCGTPKNSETPHVMPSIPVTEVPKLGEETKVELKVTSPSETLLAVTEIDGKTIMENACSLCHTVDRVISAKKNHADWESTVDRMIAKGAVLSNDQRAVLIEYLAANLK